MKSARPKPLHHLCGRPMVLYVLDAAAQEDVRATVVVVGHRAEWVEKALSERARRDVHLTFVEQTEQLGTGHAVTVALPTIDAEIGHSDGDVLIMPGDTPLLRSGTIADLLGEHRASGAALTVLTARVDDPSGYGRIVHAKNGSIARIVEERDATPDERLIDEINTSIMVVRASLLGPALRLVGRANAQNEYYLTDLVSVLYESGHLTQSIVLDDATEASGVNNLRQLADAEQVLRRRINERWLDRGVTIWSPDDTYIDAEVELSSEVSLLPGTVLKGACVIERGARIGPNAILDGVRVGANAVVGTVEATGAIIGAGARVSSFVVLAPGSVVQDGELVTPFHFRTH